MSKPKFFNLMRITMMSPCLASILGALNAAMNESGVFHAGKKPVVTVETLPPGLVIKRQQKPSARHK